MTSPSPPSSGNPSTDSASTGTYEPPTTTKWWNEEPLPGQGRPAVWWTKLLSKSPRLIGWNDEKFEQTARDAYAKSAAQAGLSPQEAQELPDFHAGPTKEVADQIALGVLGIAMNTVRDHLVSQQQGELIKEKKETVESDTSRDYTRQLGFFRGDSMKQSDFYKLTLDSLKWQRDAYLVGPQHANQRKVQRRLSIGDDRISVMPWDPLQPSSNLLLLAAAQQQRQSLGYRQLVRLGKWFVPSPTVQHSLQNIVVKLPLPGGPLDMPIQNAVSNLIPLSQNNLNGVMKRRILMFLQNEERRRVIKKNTRDSIARTYRDPRK